MSKGKSNSKSNNAYVLKKNKKIVNRSYRRVLDDKGNLTAKNFANSKGYALVTRKPETYGYEEAKIKFYRTVKSFENTNDIKLNDTSKFELLSMLLNYIETNNSIVSIKDDTKTFLLYRCITPEILKLYLFKALYPRIFDFAKPSNEKDIITFNSPYIEKNFLNIYKEITLLCNYIIVDAIIISLYEYTYPYFQSVKTKDFYIITKDTPQDILYALESSFKTEEKDDRFNIIKTYIPIIIFLSKFHCYRNTSPADNKELLEKKMTTL